MAEPLHASDFWRFSCDHYAKPGVTNACLTLQDRYGLNVNIILLAVWLGYRHTPLSVAEFEKLQQAIQPWHTKYVLPLRQLRCRLGKQRQLIQAALRLGCEALYQELKRTELQAERLQQQQLITHLPALVRTNSEMRHQNLLNYIESEKQSHHLALKEWLCRLL